VETFYGYLILQNCVPIGYGGAWYLFDTLEFGVNIFETFRGGESALIAIQVLRVFHHALGMTTVVLQPFQIGYGNPEALESGAFYFYYRIGFRPHEPGLSRLAEREQERSSRNASHPRPQRILKRLTRGEMYLTLSNGNGAPERRIKAKQLAALTTDFVARSFGGDRDAAARWATKRVVRALGARGSSAWPLDERRAFEQLSLLAALIPDLENWPAADKRHLARGLRAKGGRSEVRYARLLAGHRKFRDGLAALIAVAESARSRPLSADHDRGPYPIHDPA
jgi:hypothetical protein